MKQKLKDLQLLIKNDAKTRFILLVGLLLLAWTIFSGPTSRNRRLDARAQPTERLTNKNNNEAYGDLIERFRNELEGTKNVLTDLSKSVENQNKAQTEYEKKTAEIFKKVLERISDEGSSGGNGIAGIAGAAGAAGAPGAAGAAGAAYGGSAATAHGRFNSGAQGAYGAGGATGSAAGYPNPMDVDAGGMPGMGGTSYDMAMNDTGELESFGNEEPGVAPPPPAAPRKIAYIGTGDSVRIKLLAGVNAPTDGTPYPVVFKLSGDIQGPDGSVLPLGEARLIAAAQGSLSDSRALFRLTDLNIRYPDGSRRVFKVDGWVVGEDGIRGMQGLLIDPIGKAIGAAGFAGALDGIGKAASDAQATTYVSPYGGVGQAVTGDSLAFAAGKGLSGASREWSEIVKQRVSELVPHVQVLSGREATAVFAKPLTIDGLFESMQTDESIYSALD